MSRLETTSDMQASQDLGSALLGEAPRSRTTGMNIETIRFRYEPKTWDGIDLDKFRDAVLDLDDDVVEVDGPHIDQGFYFEVAIFRWPVPGTFMEEWEKKVDQVREQSKE
jgi:hypothetical protein